MTNIYLICAAQSEDELYLVAQGQEDSAITPRGTAEAVALAERLASEPLSRVYSSNAQVAEATAMTLCRQKGLPLQTSDALRELGLGVWEGQNWGNIAFDAPNQLQSFQNDIDSWQVENGESPRAARDRLCGELRKIAEENEGKTVAVVSHSIAIGLCLSSLGKPAPLTRENTAVSLLEWDGKTLRVIQKDDAAHLREDRFLLKYPPHQKPPFDPRVCFFLLRFVEYSEMMADAVGMLWGEVCDPRPYDRDVLLNDANRLVTLVGHVEMSPAAFLQYGVMPGWITLLCVAPSCRNAGVGTQLIGQAVMDTRMKGEDHLFVPLAKNNPHREFFLRQGFSPIEELPDGREVFAKDI